VSTTTSTGRSSNPDAALAATEAVTAARATHGEAPSVGFLFVNPRYDFATVLAAAQAVSPATEFLSTQTAGELDRAGLHRDSVLCLMLSTDRAKLVTRAATGLRATPTAVAQAVCAPFAETARAAKAAGLSLSTSVLFADGLATTGEEMVKEVRAQTRSFQQIVGGASADDGAFKASLVGLGAAAFNDGAVGLHVFDRVNWGIGVEHGMTPATARLTATRTHKNVIAEIDSRPAFEVYRDFARARGVSLDEKTAQRFLIAHELGVYFLNQLTHVRAPLSVGPNGELHVIANIPEGAQLCILESGPDSMISAARTAALEAKKNLGPNPVAGVLVFECVCRRMILRARFGEEVQAVAEVFPDVPLAGFVTYGEIARFSGRLDGWHNATVVVAAIPA